MAIIIKHPGIYSVIQDAGRGHASDKGVSPSKPMDMQLFHLANDLLDNPLDAATIEFTFQGPLLEFTDHHTLSIVGDIAYIKINNKKIPCNQTYHVSSGDQIEIGPFKSGCRGYIGFVELSLNEAFLDSYTYDHKTGFGYKITANTILEASYKSVHRKAHLNRQKAPIRVIPGPDVSAFEEGALHVLVQNTYLVDAASNRMGIRLKGTPLQHISSGDILSRPLIIGTIQVPSSGQPIVMMSDHQPSGGYTVIATVIQEDLWLLGQAKPDEPVTFQWTTLDQARLKRKLTFEDIESREFKININNKEFRVEVRDAD